MRNPLFRAQTNISQIKENHEGSGLTSGTESLTFQSIWVGFNQHLFLEASCSQCVRRAITFPAMGGEVGLSSPSLTSFREDTAELFRRATTWVCLQSSRIGTISLNSGLSCEKKSTPTHDQQHSNLSYKEEMFEKHKCSLVQNLKWLHTYNELSNLIWQPLYQGWYLSSKWFIKYWADNAEMKIGRLYPKKQYG